MRGLYEFDHLAFDEQIAREGLGKLLSDASLGRMWLIQYGGGTIGYCESRDANPEQANK